MFSVTKTIACSLCTGWTEDSLGTQSPPTSDLCGHPEQGPVFTLTLVPVNPQETSTSLTPAPRVETSTSLTPAPRGETSTSLTPAPRVKTSKKKRQRKSDSRTQQKKQKKGRLTVHYILYNHIVGSDRACLYLYICFIVSE